MPPPPTPKHFRIKRLSAGGEQPRPQGDTNTPAAPGQSLEQQEHERTQLHQERVQESNLDLPPLPTEQHSTQTTTDQHSIPGTPTHPSSDGAHDMGGYTWATMPLPNHGEATHIPQEVGIFNHPATRSVSEFHFKLELDREMQDPNALYWVMQRMGILIISLYIQLSALF